MSVKTIIGLKQHCLGHIYIYMAYLSMDPYIDPPEKRGLKSLIWRAKILDLAIEYAGVLCKFMRANCGNLLKLREFA